MSIISLLITEDEDKRQPRRLEQLMRRLLLPLGGAEDYFDGSPVVFLLDLLLPADNDTGVNFDLRLAYALCKLAQGPEKRPLRFALRPEEGFDMEQVLKISGYQELRQLAGVEFIDLTQAETVSLATDTALALDEARVYRPLAEAGLVISLAKLRAAENSLFGGAMHNLALISPDLNPMEPEQRGRALVDLYSIMAPDLTIVDGWRGDSGFQQQRGDVLLAASDAVATDAVLTALSGLDIARADTVQLAAQYGLGEGDPGNIHLCGDDISELI